MENKVFIRNWKEFLNDFKESSIIWSRLDDYVNLWDSKGKILKTVLVLAIESSLIFEPNVFIIFVREDPNVKLFHDNKAEYKYSF